MSTKNTTPTKSNLPTHIAYHVRDGKNEKGYFTRIGVAFAHKDGNGFNLLIETIPLDGKITLRVPTEKSEQAE
jgi:hypothetical protein